MRQNSADVIVVGGGPAGAYTAWSLASSGVNVLVLDRARFPRDKPCSEYLSPEASRLLDAMGVLGDVEGAGAARLSGMRVRAPSGAMMQGDFSALPAYRAYRDYGLALRRPILDAILLERARAAGAGVCESTQVTNVLRERSGTVIGVVTRDGRELKSRIVIGADGLRSVVASRVGLARRWRTPRRIAIVTHYDGVAGMAPYGEMHVSADGYLGLAPVGSGLTNVALVVPARIMQRWEGSPESLLDHRIARDPSIARRFAHSSRVTPVRATGPFASRARRAWSPGVALVGDAADFFDPFTGEGIFAAMYGAELLAPVVRAALDAPHERTAWEILSSCDYARQRAFSGKWIFERLVAIAVGSPILLNGAVRAMRRRKWLADHLVGVAGDFVPPSAALSLPFTLAMLANALAPRSSSGVDPRAGAPAPQTGA